MAAPPSYDLVGELTPDELARNYCNVCERVAQACADRVSSVHTNSHSATATHSSVISSGQDSRNRNNNDEGVTLVAISKTKSPKCVQAVYDCGHRVFGENYVHELVAKAAVLPPDIQWHFVGHLQSNKVKDLITGVPNLSVVQTVDTVKLASKLDAAWMTAAHANSKDNGDNGNRSSLRSLSVYIQVNTSGEESKSGTEPGVATVELARFITNSCPHLRLAGLMTIGMQDYTSTPECFTRLLQCRVAVAEALEMPVTSLVLSMGMSGDFVQAIGMGSTSVRVGSAIFGERHYPAK